MGLRFRRSFKIAPGIRLNVSKSGVSTSIGRPGATVNIGHSKTTVTAGLPGTGLSYRTSSTPPYGIGRAVLVLGFILLLGLIVAAIVR